MGCIELAENHQDVANSTEPELNGVFSGLILVPGPYV